MIANAQEYEIACKELKDLEDRLTRLRTDYPGHEKGLTKAGVRKLIARLHEELAVFEGHRQVEQEPVT
jgi:hypothetical protein